MKYKVLVSGRNKAIIDDFFTHIDFECQSTSMRYDDIASHLKYYKPDAFVYCIQNERQESLEMLNRLKGEFLEAGTSIVLIGDREECEDLQDFVFNVVDLILYRPISASAIQENILQYLCDRDLEREKEAEKKRAAEKAKEKKRKEDGDFLTDIEARLDELGNADFEPIQKENVSFQRKHILVIDDDARMLKLVKGHLKDNYNVATAINGRLAMKFLENKKTDLILLDYEMPGESGPDVFRILRENKSTRKVPIVFLTGVDDMQKVQEVLKLKPQGYLLKPIDHDKLISTIEGLLDK